MSDTKPFALPEVELSLHREYIAERKNKKWFNLFSILMIFGSSVLFLIILFRGGYTADTRLVILMYWGYFTSFSSMLLIPYYQYPQLILNLNSTDLNLRDCSWSLILRNPRFYIQPVFYSQRIDLPQGMDFSAEGFRLDRDWILQKFHIYDRLDWKGIGKRYLVFYLIITPVLLSLFLSGFSG